MLSITRARGRMFRAKSTGNGESAVCSWDTDGVLREGVYMDVTSPAWQSRVRSRPCAGSISGLWR
jgi:hypothetical protein